MKKEILMKNKKLDIAMNLILIVFTISMATYGLVGLIQTTPKMLSAVYRVMCDD